MSSPSSRNPSFINTILLGGTPSQKIAAARAAGLGQIPPSGRALCFEGLSSEMVPMLRSSDFLTSVFSTIPSTCAMVILCAAILRFERFRTPSTLFRATANPTLPASNEGEVLHHTRVP